MTRRLHEQPLPPAGSGGARLRVLLLEDDPAHAELALRELRRAGFIPDWQRVETEQDFLAQLDPTLDLILADYNVALFDASRALRLMQDRGLDIPFIVVSATIGEDMAVSILKQGATDYLLKDRLARLGEAVRRALEQRRLLAEEQAQRRQAQEATIRAREADRANKAKSEFLSLLSHELRTPLNAILGFAQLLEMSSLAPDQRESVDQILKGGQHLIELITEVLDIARIEAGQMSLTIEPVPLNKTAQETLTMVTPLAANAGIHLNAGTAAVPERLILADRQRFKQVLLNLISNAIKYNRPGGGVTVSYEEVTPGRLRIKVSDTGPGIPQDKMHRLFAPFDRLGAEQREVEGTGLGLALSKRLVEAMGGTLGVESVEGQGSTFWVELAQAPPAQRP